MPELFEAPGEAHRHHHHNRLAYSIGTLSLLLQVTFEAQTSMLTIKAPTQGTLASGPAEGDK